MKGFPVIEAQTSVVSLPCWHQPAVLSTYCAEGRMPPPASALAHRLAVIHMSNLAACALASGVHVSPGEDSLPGKHHCRCAPHPANGVISLAALMQQAEKLG